MLLRYFYFWWRFTADSCFSQVNSSLVVVLVEKDAIKNYTSLRDPPEANTSTDDVTFLGVSSPRFVFDGEWMFDILSYSMCYTWQTDRQRDRYFIDRNKSHYRLICHSNKRDICTCIYTRMLVLLKSYMIIYMVWQTAIIMLSGIAIIKTGYFGDINGYFLK